MTSKHHLRAVAVALGMAAGLRGVGGCFVDNPARAVATVDAGVPEDAGVDGRGDGAAAVVDAGPPLCTKYGGYATVELVVGDLFSALLADCRISKFFTALPDARLGHLHDCLVKQVAVVMGCPGIRYDVDNEGVDCRDMVTAHRGLSIRSADFDALLEDLAAVLLKDGVAPSDIDLLAPRLLALRDDIVTNSAPGHGKTCDAGSSGP